MKNKFLYSRIVPYPLMLVYLLLPTTTAFPLAGLMEHTDFEHLYHLENIKDCDKQSLHFDQSNKGFIGQKLLHICNN